jgi:hypothetical protein
MKDEEIEYAAQDLNQTLSVDEAKSINSDDALLLSMGKKPELRRVYNFWTCMSASQNLSQLKPQLAHCLSHSVCLSDHDLV